MYFGLAVCKYMKYEVYIWNEWLFLWKPWDQGHNESEWWSEIVGVWRWIRVSQWTKFCLGGKITRALKVSVNWTHLMVHRYNCHALTWSPRLARKWTVVWRFHKRVVVNCQESVVLVRVDPEIMWNATTTTMDFVKWKSANFPACS